MDQQDFTAAKGAGNKTRQGKRILAGMIVSAMVLTSGLMCSCGKKKQPQTPTVEALPREITADTPWYDGRSVDVEAGVDKSNYEDFFSSYIGSSGERIVFELVGLPITDPNEPVDYNNIQEFKYRVFDMDGNLMYDKDVKEIIRDYLPEDTWFHYERSNSECGNIYIEATADIDGEYQYLRFTFDPVEGQITSSETAERSSGVTTVYEVIEGYTVISQVEYDGMDTVRDSVRIVVTSPEGDVTTLNVNELYPDLNIREISGCLYLGEHRLLLSTIDFSYTMDFNLILDLQSSELTKNTDESLYSWINTMDLVKCHYEEGIGNVTCDQSGIKVIDFMQQSVDELISYNNCNINRADSSNVIILSMTEDHIVLLTSSVRVVTNVPVGDSIATQILILDKAPSNPHAGDNVLTASSIGGNLSYPTAEAIRLYNEQDNGTLILFDPRYTFDTILDETDLTAFDSGTGDIGLSLDNAAISKLTIDLMAGEGPDLIFDALQYRQLDNSGLLLDLSDIIPDLGLYDNVIDSAKTGGRLFQIPLAFSLKGLLISNEDAQPDAAGFTFDTYSEYVSGACNGIDPTRMSRLDFMSACLRQISGQFVSGNGYDFDSEAFRQTASFVNDLVLPAEIPFDPEAVTMETYRSSLQTSNYVSIPSASEYLRQTQGLIDDMRLYGFPSSEGSGPLISVIQSVAVCSSTQHPEECRAFASILISEEFQQLYSDYAGLPVNPSALHQTVIADTEDFNVQADRFTSNLSDVERFELGLPMNRVDPDELFDVIDSYITNSCGISAVDAAVEMIAHEELQAYFAGQKTLDEVIAIMQDRADTYVNERG